MAPGLRVLVYDRTCVGPRGLPGLSACWRVGAELYRALGRFDACVGAASWDEALRRITAVSPWARIQELQYWGHGTWGSARIDQDVLDVSALEPGHALYEPLAALRERFVAAGAGLWWFRTCETFGTAAGHRLAVAWARFFNARVAGHTYVIGQLQSGLHSLRPGQAPGWSVAEGLPLGPPEATSALSSRWGAPNTITCLQDRLPEGF